MARRFYSSSAARTALTSGVTNVATTMIVDAATNFPAVPFTLLVDGDTVLEEAVEVTARSGTTLTVTRGVDGTTGVSHLAGAVAQHGVTARDYDEPNAHIAATVAHGITGAVVGTTDTQALTNKTLDSTNTVAQAAVTGLVSDLATKAPLLLSTSAQAASYTLVLADAYKVVEISNASANNLTVPTNASQAFPVGTQITFVQTGAGQTTIVPAGGVTVNSASGALKLVGQWAGATLIKRGTDTWVAIGALTT